MADFTNYVATGYWASGYTEVAVNYGVFLDIQKLAPSSIIELFEVDASVVGGDVYRFHSGKNALVGDIVWQGNTYTAFPIEAEGFEWNGKGQMPRPTVTVSNVLGSISALVLLYQDLAGCKVTRIRTLAKFLDEVNFPPQRNLFAYTQDPSQAYWTKVGSSVSAGAGTDPFGEPVEKLVEDTSTGSHYLSRARTYAIGDTVTASYYVKADGRSRVALVLQGTAFPTAQRVFFNLSTGTATVTLGAPTYTITPVGTDWWRVSITSTAAAAGSGSALVALAPATGTSLSYTGDGSSGALVTRAQLELASAPTEYQPVTGSAFYQNPTADPTAEFPRDIYYIDRKAAETRDAVQFELAAAMDLAGVALPRRQIIQNYCPWIYRSSECGYTGTNYFDSSDVPVASAGQDVCGKRLSSCQCRFGQYATLPYGGFPGAGLLKQ